MFTINAKNLDIQQIPGSAYSLIEQSSPEKHFYQIDDAPISLLERIQLFVRALFKTVASTFCCQQYDNLKLQWKQVFAGKKILVMEGSELLAECGSKKQLSRSDLSDLVASVKSKSSKPIPTPQTIPPQTDSTTIKLNYSGKQYENVPGEICSHRNLQELLLSMNKIKELPENMSTLLQLKRLDLKVNQISVLPDWIGNLYQLETLELNANQLTALPKSLYKLTNLKKLYLSGNRFETVPKVLFQLPKECQVTLNHNPLTNETLADLKARIESEGYNGPQFIYPKSGAQEIPTERPFDVVLGEWTDKDTTDALAKLSKQKQARLINFLDRLKKTTLFENQPEEIKRNVSNSLNWLLKENTGQYKKIAFTLIKTYAGDCDGAEKTYSALLLMQKLTADSHIDLKGVKDFILIEVCSKQLHKFIADKHPEEDKCKLIFYDYWEALRNDMHLPSNSSQKTSNLRLDPENILEAKSQLNQLIGTPQKTAQCLAKNPVWKVLLERQNSFPEIKVKCEKEKTQFLNTLSLEDQTTKGDQIILSLNTIWEPYYVLTLDLLKRL